MLFDGFPVKSAFQPRRNEASIVELSFAPWLAAIPCCKTAYMHRDDRMDFNHAERWQSGLSHSPRKREYLYGYREFESPPLRHFFWLYANNGGNGRGEWIRTTDLLVPNQAL